MTISGIRSATKHRAMQFFYQALGFVETASFVCSSANEMLQFGRSAIHLILIWHTHAQLPTMHLLDAPIKLPGNDPSGIDC